MQFWQGFPRIIQVSLLIEKEESYVVKLVFLRRRPRKTARYFGVKRREIYHQPGVCLFNLIVK
jgi:hypothetical protein